jgi:DNA-binding response OmpR family regulator
MSQDFKLPEPPGKDGKFRILVVEDDSHIARLILANLARGGFETRHAPDGNIGWEAFCEWNPHLLLLDRMMPGMNGGELCAKIREKSTVPIIMLTALSGEDQQVEGIKLGADDYVPKPFNPRLLMARTVSWLRRVYRYDFSNTAAAAAAASPPVPPGWATCEACGYMGPKDKFQHTTASGQTHLKCPFCKQGEFIVFSVV